MKYIIALQNVLCCLTKSMRNILPFSILAFYHLISRVTFKKTWKCSFPFSLLSLNSSSWDHPTKPSLSLWGNWFREMEWLVIYHFYFILCTCVFMTKIRLFSSTMKRFQMQKHNCVSHAFYNFHSNFACYKSAKVNKK